MNLYHYSDSARTKKSPEKILTPVHWRTTMPSHLINRQKRNNNKI